MAHYIKEFLKSKYQRKGVNCWTKSEYTPFSQSAIERDSLAISGLRSLQTILATVLTEKCPVGSS